MGWRRWSRSTKRGNVAREFRKLDFDDVPSLHSCQLRKVLDEDLRRAIEVVPGILGRALSAIKFSLYISESREGLHCADEGDTLLLREGFLRAALAEFVGMEEMAKSSSPTNVHHVSICSSKKPLLHILRELRNHELHLRASPLSSISKPVSLVSVRQCESPPVELEIPIWYVDSITTESFQLLRNARYYQAEDLKQMVAWFNRAQKEWGICHLIWLAVNEYARIVVSTLSSAR
jgi:hypothetical protein